MIVRRLSQSLMAAAFVAVSAVALMTPAHAAPGVQLCDSSAPPNCVTVTNNKLDTNSAAPVGGATSANQTTQITAEQGIQTTAGAIGDTQSNGTIVGYLKSLWSIFNSSAPATSALQTTGNSSLSTIATNTTGLATASGQSTAASTLSTIATNTTGAATAANQTTANSSLSTIATNTTSIATTANQTTANSSLSTIATNTTGLATAATQTSSATTLSTIATNTTPSTARNVSLDNVIDGVVQTASATSAATLLTFTNTAGYGYISIVVTSAGASNTLEFDPAADGSTYVVNTQIWWRGDAALAPGIGGTSFLSANQVFILPVQGQAVRIKVSAYSSGTVTIYAVLKRGTPPPPYSLAISGTITASNTAGNVASGSADSGNPVKVGGKYNASQPSLTDGNRGDLQIGSNGQLLTKPFAAYVNTWNYAAASGGISNSTAGVTIKTADATRRVCLTGVQLSSDALGAATEIVVRDGASGTVVWRGKVTTAGVAPTSYDLSTPVCGTANTLMEIATLTATITGGVYFNAQGYVAP